MSENQERMYSLRDVAGCEGTDRPLNLPQIQRGLVWKAAQIELLWDSILRGFPIGSFVVAEFADAEGKSSMQLLDGQQRMNAIKLGYHQFDEGEKEDGRGPVLWFDLAPKNAEKSTRKYWARLCTPAHPWGYKANDKCEVLNTATKRDACQKYGASDVYKPTVCDTWPHDAKCPVPFVYLVHAAEDMSRKHGDGDDGNGELAENAFIDEIIKLIKNETRFKFPDPEKETLKFADVAREELEKNKKDLYEAFKQLESYRVSTVALPEGFLKEKDQLGSIECFFERMNTGGTRISSEDLFYSTVKANFKELDLKTYCDKLAGAIMPPSHLAILSFRLARTLVHEDLEKLQPIPTLAQIRTLARKKDEEEYRNIVELWEMKGGIRPIEQLLETVNGWISYKEKENLIGLPPVLRLSIILGSSDVFLLLLWLAKKDEKTGLVDAEMALQLATLLHWFSTDKHNKACNAIVKACYQQQEVSKAAIQMGLASAIQQNSLIIPYSFEVFEEEENWEWNPDWKWWDEWGVKSPYFWDWIERIRWNKELLLYAQRKYLDQKFPEYNPADKVLFERQNRPWDFDHIVPRDWMNNKRKASFLKFSQEWRDSIGNFAAIPFEINRSKGKESDWSEYREDTNSEGLLFQEEFAKLSEETLAYDEATAYSFASAAKRRLIEIYKTWFSGLRLGNLLSFKEDNLPKSIRLRKELFERVKGELGNDADIFFVHGDCGYQVTTNSQHCADWLTVGVPRGKCMPCITIGVFGDDGQVELEFGIRKAPGEKQLDENYKKEIFEQLAQKDDSLECHARGWWYLYHGERVSFDRIDTVVASYVSKIKAYVDAVKG